MKRSFLAFRQCQSSDYVKLKQAHCQLASATFLTAIYKWYHFNMLCYSVVGIAWGKKGNKIHVHTYKEQTTEDYRKHNDHTSCNKDNHGVSINALSTKESIYSQQQRSVY